MAVDWRKVWIEPPAELDGLPVVALSVYFNLYRLADDDGLVCVIPAFRAVDRQSAAAAVTHRLGAHPEEVATVLEAALMVIDAGALALTGRAVVIKDFAEIQDRKSTAAEQKARQRARKKRALELGAGGPPAAEGSQVDMSAPDARTCPPALPDMSVENVHDETRRDEKRRDESGARAHAMGTTPGAEAPGTTVHPSPPAALAATSLTADPPGQGPAAPPAQRHDPAAGSPAAPPSTSRVWNAGALEKLWTDLLERRPGHMHKLPELAERIAADAALLRPPQAPADYARALLGAFRPYRDAAAKVPGKRVPSESVAGFVGWYDDVAEFVRLHPQAAPPAPGTAPAGPTPTPGARPEEATAYPYRMPNGSPWPRELWRCVNELALEPATAMVAKMRRGEPFRFDADGNAKF